MKYTVIGRVHPERANIYFDQIELSGPGRAKITLRCDSSQLTVIVDHPEVDGWRTAQLTAEDAAMIIVASLGFSLGCGYSVEVIQSVDENGRAQVVSVKPDGKELGEHLGFDNHVSEFNRAFQLAAQNIFFRLALRDYTRALTETKDCGTYCYRVIEAIKSALSTEKDLDAWDTFHKNMDTNKEQIETVIKQFADPVRHGNWIEAKSTDHFQRWDMLKLTRDVLVQYLDLASEPHNGSNSDADNAGAG